jgi:ATP-dependent Clp protease adaptor protein ClpS
VSSGDNKELIEVGGGTQTLTKPENKTKKPSLYKVILLNDDFTPRDFVVHILMHFFNKNETEATQLMLDIHTKGSGLAGVYSYEIAETKTFQVNAYSKQQQFPLKCIMEES